MTIPNGWKEVKLGDISIISSGFTFKRRYQGFSGLKWNYFKVLDIGLPSNHKYLRTAVNTVDDSMVAEIKCVPFERGSIVFPRVGAALKNNNKKILAQDSIVDDNTLAVTVHNDNYSNEYVYYWLETIDLAELCNDGTVPVLGARKIGEIDILFPPLPEQQKIARILCAWDAAIEKTENLVAEKERAYSFYVRKFIEEPTAKNMWQTFRLHELLSEGSKKAVADTGKYKKITVKLHKAGLAFFESERKMADTRPFYIRHTNELIIGKQNYFNGSIALVPPEFDNCICSNAIMSFKISPNANVVFLFEALSYKAYLKRHEAFANGTGQKELSESEFLNFTVSLPPLSEQEKVAAFLTSAKKEITLLRSLAGEYRRQKQWLMQKLLTGSLRVK